MGSDVPRAVQLQANWHRGALYLWGAAGADAPADVGAIRAAVGEVCSDGLLASAAPEGTLEFACDGPPTVPALVLAPAEAIDFLTCLPEPLPGACGTTVGYWAKLARFVCALIAAKQFIPRVDEVGGGEMLASWRVLVMQRAHLQWLERLATALPAVCRSADGGPDAATLVETFLAATADALVRRAVAGDSFFQEVGIRAERANPPAGPEGRWLAALLGHDARFYVDDPEERAAFVQQTQAWLGQLDDTQAAALRLVFMLTEPPEPPEEDAAALASALADMTRDDAELEDHLPHTGNGDGAHHDDESVRAESFPQSDLNGDAGGAASAALSPEVPVAPPPSLDWNLSFHLQPLDGEGDLIPAASLWSHGSGPAPILGRSVAKRQAALLAELSRAAEVFPPVQGLLSHPAPADMGLTTTDAYAFIRHWSGILRDRGFGVVLPDWASDPDEEIGLRLLLSPADIPDPDDDDGPFDDTALGGNARRARNARMAESLDLSTGQFGLDSLVNFNWQIAVGDLKLTAQEFQDLVGRNVPLVRHKGKWIRLDLDATRKAVEFMAKQTPGKTTLADAFRTAFTANKAETGLNVIGLTGTSWIEKLLDQSTVTAPEDLTQPLAFKGDLRPYQLRGLHWMAFLDRIGLGACLADDMGLGKTIQLISLMLYERERAEKQRSQDRSQKLEDGAGLRTQDSALSTQTADPQSAIRHPKFAIGPTLLFAPTSVVGNWLRELQRFAPTLKLIIHHGPDRMTGDTFTRAAQESDVVVTSYSLAHRDRDELARVRWHRIALDEAQKIKNPAAAATVAIRSLYAPHRVALTGTPIENHLSELWSIMQVLNPGLLGTAADFREKFAVPIEKMGEKDRAAQLRNMIRPFILRRTKADPTIAGDLPDKLEMKVFCNLTAEQASLYERLVNDSLRQIDGASGIRRRGLILATLTRLKQICDHPALLDDKVGVPRGYEAPNGETPTKGSLDRRSGKLERLLDMCEELLDEGDAALVFTQYREMGHLLERAIKSRLGKETFFLHGGTPAKGRDDMIQAFQAQAPGTPRIFLLSLRAGGLGLNLTAANHVFHFDRWWNPAVEAQATDRAHRVGQTRQVQVHKFVCIGTMEERIDRLLSEKQALADQIVGSGDEWLTNFSTEQLREYLSLSREAVGEFD